MDFSWNDEQIALKNTIIEFSKKELNHGMVQRDKKGEFSWASWKKCAELGILGLPVPEEYGGSNADILTIILAMEGLGYGCKDSGLIFAINTQMWSCEEPILKFGSEPQKRKYLPRLCAGELVGGHGMTEPDSGSDAFSLQTRAARDKDKYILNGSKMFITNAPIADVLIVFALTDKTKGWGGISAFLVEKGTPGFSVSRELDKMGLKTSPVGELAFEDCEVPAENILGKEGMGMAIFNSEMEWERSCLFASHLGVMERQLETCINYAKERRQFGQPIGKFQSISNKIADMKARIELSRLILYKIGWLKSRGEKGLLEAAIAKLYVSESFVKSSLDAIQIHGGYGYMTDFEVERDLRDSVASTIYSGTSEIQRNTISRWLLGL
ncbi:MAG: acyl-CoA dehydrogenase [Chloroflexi bacterium RBG_16_50_9]|nr:MAG: acyl-CoA dehydrogenase [Chloroflexi bacterium RBG_16_50_9]